MFSPLVIQSDSTLDIILDFIIAIFGFNYNVITN